MYVTHVGLIKAIKYPKGPNDGVINLLGLGLQCI